MNQELIIKIQIMEQEANQLNEQLQMVEQNVNEMLELKASLDEIGKEENKDILANIGKKIFIPVEIKTKELIVEVGKGHYVKKTPEETIKIVESQLDRLMEGKTQIVGRLDELQNEMQSLIKEIEKEQAVAGNEKTN